MAKGKAKTERLQIVVALETNAYLALLAERGTHGSSITDVARTLIEQGIRNAFREGFLNPDDRARVQRRS